MFTLREEMKYELPITVDLPDPQRAGKRLQERFYATFRALSISETEEIRQRAQRASEADMLDASRDTLRNVLKGWRDIKDDNGVDLPFNDDMLDQVLNNQFATTALMTAYIDSLTASGKRARRLGN